jgi:hypothetical protein
MYDTISVHVFTISRLEVLVLFKGYERKIFLAGNDR